MSGFRQFAPERHRPWWKVAGLLCVLLVVPALVVRGQPPLRAGHFYTSLRGVHVAGYQGWFDCPDDGAGLGWGHWFRGGAKPRDPAGLAIGMWPDTAELGAGELCPAGFRLASGAPAYLYSAQNPTTVMRHFRWMAQYGIDGAAMQRFAADLARPAVKRHLDWVLRNARAAAEANRRGFFVMYDLSGISGDAARRLIERDWPYLARDLRLTDSPAYIEDRGRPLVGVWGLGFRDRDIGPEEAAAIIAYLKSGPVPATVLGGVPAAWRTLGARSRWQDARGEPGWPAVYRSLDIISPWTVGRFRDDDGADAFARLELAPDIAETRRLGIGYMPVIFPGTAWPPALGAARPPIARRCGEFYRRQFRNAVVAEADTLYTAMFDEVNEGTAIFKLAVTPAQDPAGALLSTLDAGGCVNASSDLYLRLAGEATRLLRSRR